MYSRDASVIRGHQLRSRARSFCKFSAISSTPSSVILLQPDKESTVKCGSEWTVEEMKPRRRRIRVKIDSIQFPKWRDIKVSVDTPNWNVKLSLCRNSISQCPLAYDKRHKPTTIIHLCLYQTSHSFGTTACRGVLCAKEICIMHGEGWDREDLAKEDRIFCGSV